MTGDHNCTQVCVDVEGSFNCSCYSGYELQEDGATCTGSYLNKVPTYVNRKMLDANVETYFI